MDKNAKIDDVLKVLKEHRDTYAHDFGVVNLAVFGSIARGDSHENSDIDIMVELDKDYEKYKNFMRFKFYLEELLNSKVDLVTKNSIREELRDDILKDLKYA